MKNTEKEIFTFSTKVYSWDSDQYAEYKVSIDFDSLEQLDNFCADFMLLQEEENPSFYFGKSIDINDYNQLLEKHGKYPYFDTGGISVEFKRFYKIVREGEIK